MQKDRSLLRIFLLALLTIFLVGCAGIGIKPWSERSSQEKGLAFMEMYNAQYDDTMRLAVRRDLTEDGKKIVRAKKELLIKTNKLMIIYLGVVEGGLQNLDLENKILGLLEKLAGMTY